VRLFPLQFYIDHRQRIKGEIIRPETFRVWGEFAEKRGKTLARGDIVSISLREIKFLTLGCEIMMIGD